MDQDNSNQSVNAPASPTAINSDLVQPLHFTVDFERNVYSQSGEDGIIEKVMSLYGMEPGIPICIEIGASDGFTCSNTAYLREKGWFTLLIEANPVYESRLNIIQNARVVIKEVTPDNVCEAVFGWDIPPKCAVLSVDTDGDDVLLAQTLIHGGLRPRIVVVEYNPTIPPFIHRLNTRGKQQGSSIRACIEELAKEDYIAIYATISNVIFVDTHQNQDIIRPMNAFEAFRWDDVRFVCSDFDGQNYFATMTEIVDEVYNAWDRLPSARIMHYPDRLLGFSKTKAKLRALYNYYGE